MSETCECCPDGGKYMPSEGMCRKCSRASNKAYDEMWSAYFKAVREDPNDPLTKLVDEVIGDRPIGLLKLLPSKLEER